MTLIVEELLTTLTLEVTTDAKVKQVYAVRPHMYRHGSPAGSVYVEIRTTADAVVATSDTRAITSIGTGTYWHGKSRFVVSAHLAPNTTYKVVLIASGYTFAEAAYLGWANSFDLASLEATYTPAVGFSAPLAVEMWTRRHAPKGAA